MDPKFLEFWGNYLLAVSRGQQQMEDLTRWMQQGFTGVQNLNDMFKAVYGLPTTDAENSGLDETWQTATASFNASFKEYFEQLGWVPRQDLEDLSKENAALKKQVETLEKTVKRLRNLIDSEYPEQSESVDALQELAEKQGAEFNKLMQNLSEAMDKNK